MRLTYRAIGTALVLLGLSGALASVHAQEDQIYTQRGVLSDVNDQTYTIKVQVPLDDGQQMTVAGPLVEGAIIRIEGHTGGLPDLMVGENVTVTWKATPEGVAILSVQQR